MWTCAAACQCDRRAHHGASGYARQVAQEGYTLIELLTTVAVLVVVLGLLVSLAGDVRRRSADTLMRELLYRLDQEVVRNAELREALTRVPPLVKSSGGVYDGEAVQRAALENSRASVRIWREVTKDLVVRDQPVSIYDEVTLRDAWGTPIVYMPAGALNVGMVPQSRAFFMSAGPDRSFTTLEDNLYSYEQGRRQGAGQ